MRYVFVLLSVLLLPLAASAHEGHDHDAPAPLADAALAPRMEARSELFELVAVLDGGRLLTYLDRAATNEPVAGAVVELEAGADKAQAREIAPGVYAADLAILARPGEHPLVVAVSAGDDADLLNGKLAVPAPKTAATTGEAPRWRVGWAGGGAALALAVAAALALRRRGRREGAA